MGNEELRQMAPDPCTLHVQIRQTWTGPAPIVVHATYTVSDLARLWRRPESSIRVWISLLRRHPYYAPNPPFVRKVQTNVVRRHLEIRDDYAQLLRGIFIDRTIPK